MHLEELTSEELKETQGGWYGIAVAVGLYVIAEWEELKEGWDSVPSN